MNSRELVSEAELETLQHKSFSYFLHESNPDNGLMIDKTAANWPASIARHRPRVGGLPCGCRARIYAPCHGGGTNVDHAAFFLE